MAINISMPVTEAELKPRIVVVGVGGAGGNAVENMIRSQLGGVDFLVANTDAQSLAQSSAEQRIQLGATVTQGLGAGSRPDVGRAAAEEGLDQIIDQLQGSHMVFITAGMGGGTGTGGAPVLARAARELGVLTVGVVTKPFHFEGVHRMKVAELGIEELQQYVDTLILIPNQNLFRVANEKTTFADAFKMADDVLYSGVRGVTDLMVMPGLINLDFADIRSVMSEMGKAVMGTGEADSEQRALDAAEAAISNPLLDDISMKGARGVLINITGGLDMTLFEVDEAANRIRDEVDPEANIIFGSTLDETIDGRMRVSVVATGIEAGDITMPHPIPLSLVTHRGHRIKDEAPGKAEPSGPEPAATDAAPVPELATAGTSLEADKLGFAPGSETDLGADSTPPDGDPGVTVPADMDNGLDALGDHADDPPATPAEEPEGAGNETFIPPRPVVPSRSPDSEPDIGIDPFAAAALANGGRLSEKPKRRATSLFARVTGAARGREPAEGRPVQPTAEPVQPKLGGLDPVDRIKTSELDEDDLLDIPAFLRRQAN